MILIVLISSIVVAALPVFGPHTDRLESQNRLLFVQGSQSDGLSNNRNVVDAGDLVQGIFRADRFVGGGLDKRNDQALVADDGSKPNDQRTVIGFYSFRVESMNGLIGNLIAAKGQNNVANLVEQLGVRIDETNSGTQSDCYSIIVLTSESGEIDFDNLETTSSLNDPRFWQQLSEVNDWSVRMIAGFQSEDDFSEVKFTDANKGVLKDLKKTRVRKRAGLLKVLNTICFDREHPTRQYKSVKLRSWSDNHLAKGDLKIDEAEISGVSRRKRKGFDFGGKLDVQWSATPEQDASALAHTAQFLTGNPSASEPAEAGMGPALWGSIWVCTFCALFALPLGIGTAVFLEEFQPTNRVLRFFQSLIQLNITNLAGVPSIVYGILGLTMFATMFGIFGSDKEPGLRLGGDHFYQYLSEGMYPILVPITDADQVPVLIDGMEAEDGDHNPVILNVIAPDGETSNDQAKLKWTIRSDAQGGIVSELPWYYFQLPFGRGVLAAALTLMLVILPVIIISSQEAIKGVPSTLRQGAMGLGATRWQVVRNVTLPAAIPGIMTGAILSISRAIGEAAPIVVLCGIVFVASAPQHLMDFYTVLPVQIFHLTGMPVSEEGAINFQSVAAAASLVLLAVLLTFNTIAIVLRQWTTKPLT